MKKILEIPLDYVACDLYTKSDKSSFTEDLKHKSYVKMVKDVVVFYI